MAPRSPRAQGGNCATRVPPEPAYCPICCEPVEGGLTTETGAVVHSECMADLVLP